MSAVAGHRFPSARAFILAMLLLPLTAGALVAQPYWVRAATRVQTSGFGISDPQYDNVDTGIVQAVSISVGPRTVTSSQTEYASASAQGQSVMGYLRASGSYNCFSNGSYAGGNSMSSPETWHDTITITSDSLPPGTPVTLQATMTAHRTMAGQPDSNEQMYVACGSAYFSLYISDNNTNPDPTQSVSSAVNVNVGSQFIIEMNLNVTAAGTAYQFHPESGYVIVNEAYFTLVPTTPGVSYTTASGVSYVTPALDGDINVSGRADGNDISTFAAALMSASTAPSDLYHADFNVDGLIDADDVPGFINKLLH